MSFDPATGRVAQILAGTANSIASFSYSWDAAGNLASRADTYQGYTEQFCYDVLNRLVNSAFGASCTAAGGKTVGYDSLGNILSKSGVGTYSYPAAGMARPHAVSSIAGMVNGVLNPAFAYDADGNMTGGAGRSVTWTSFNMAAQVTQGTTTVAFAYDSAHNRITQTIGGASPSTTTYLNALGAQSEKFVAGSTTTWHDYIYAAGNLVAERFCSGAAPCAGGIMRYAVSDHLSSPSSLTDASGTVTERLSYDAWGARRNADATDALCGAIASATTRGFTGHETMDAVCLVNMNARLYDPAIGRFMSADSVVSDPGNGQAYNRYAYVLGNPLRYVDPSGHDSCGVSADGVECVLVQQDAYPDASLVFGIRDIAGPDGLRGDGGERPDRLKNDKKMNPNDCPQDGVVETVCVTANRLPSIPFGISGRNGDDKARFICRRSDGSYYSSDGAGLGVGAGQALARGDAPTIDKFRAGVSGGGPSGNATSPLSSNLRRAFGNSKFQQLEPFTGTTSVGGSLARGLGLFGILGSFLDFYAATTAPDVCVPAET